MTKEAEDFIAAGSALKLEEVYKDIEHLLSEKAKRGLSKRVMQTIGLKDDGSVEYVVKYFGLKTVDKTVGAIKMAKIVNGLAEKYEILGVLAPPVQIVLAVTDTSGAIIATCCYIAVSADDAVKMDANGEKWLMGINDMSPSRYLETIEDMEEAKALEEANEQTT